jgi:hypothetical protein
MNLNLEFEFLFSKYTFGEFVIKYIFSSDSLKISELKTIEFKFLFLYTILGGNVDEIVYDSISKIPYFIR